MKIEEMVQSIRARDAVALGQVPDKRLVSVVRAVLREIGARIDAVDKGAVMFPVLGRFGIKTIEKEGKPPQKRIGLRRAKGKAKKRRVKAD